MCHSSTLIYVASCAYVSQATTQVTGTASGKKMPVDALAPCVSTTQRHAQGPHSLMQQLYIGQRRQSLRVSAKPRKLGCSLGKRVRLQE